MMTKKQIEEARRYLKYCAQSTDWERRIDEIFDLALVGLAVRPRPIIEFDEINPPVGWFLVKDGLWVPAFWSEEGAFKLFGCDVGSLDPTHFIPLSALPEVKP